MSAFLACCRSLVRSMCARGLTLISVAMQATISPGQLASRLAQPRSLIALLGNTVTILTVLGPPLAYALISYFELQHRAQEHAAMGARHVEQQLRTAAASTALEDITVGVVHATRRQCEAKTRTGITIAVTGK